MKTAARRFLTALALGAAVALPLLPAAAGNSGGDKVVVELFTSQGCSSCPPADALLAELAERDDVIALSFHVDYWNYIGWTDPFSSPQATARHRAYGRALGRAYVYTPQMVVDGRAETVGSNRRAVDSLIRMAGGARKLAIEVAHPGDGTAVLRLPAASGGWAGDADVWIGFYDENRSTDVAAGENRGVRVVNANVVRVFRRVARWTGAPLERALDLEALGAGGRDGCVIVVQATGSGPILAAAAFPLAGN